MAHSHVLGVGRVWGTIRVGKSVKNSTDTMSQKMQKCAKTQQNCAKIRKIVQKKGKISKAGKN